MQCLCESNMFTGFLPSVHMWRTGRYRAMDKFRGYHHLVEGLVEGYPSGWSITPRTPLGRRNYGSARNATRFDLCSCFEMLLQTVNVWLISGVINNVQLQRVHKKGENRPVVGKVQRRLTLSDTFSQGGGGVSEFKTISGRAQIQETILEIVTPLSEFTSMTPIRHTRSVWLHPYNLKAIHQCDCILTILKQYISSTTL